MKNWKMNSGVENDSESGMESNMENENSEMENDNCKNESESESSMNTYWMLTYKLYCTVTYKL